MRLTARELDAINGALAKCLADALEDDEDREGMESAKRKICIRLAALGRSAAIKACQEIVDSGNRRKLDNPRAETYEAIAARALRHGASND